MTITQEFIKLTIKTYAHIQNEDIFEFKEGDSQTVLRAATFDDAVKNYVLTDREIDITKGHKTTEEKAKNLKIYRHELEFTVIERIGQVRRNAMDPRLKKDFNLQAQLIGRWSFLMIYLRKDLVLDEIALVQLARNRLNPIKQL